MSSSEYPLSRVRKVQVILSALSFPNALAAIFTSGVAPETPVQLIFLVTSGLSAAFMYLIHRGSKKNKPLGKNMIYPTWEILVDLFHTVALGAIYIAGMVLFSTRWDSRYSRPITGIPQAYANLLCLILAMTHLFALGKALRHRYSLRIKKKRTVMFVQCPTCAAVAQAAEAESGDFGGQQESQDRTPHLRSRDLYTDDDSESKPLLAAGQDHDSDLLRPSEEDARPMDV